MGLADRKCVPCRGGAPAVAAEEAGKLLAEIPGWTLEDGATRIRRRFRFRNFVTAMAFAQAVGDLAEREGHHPDLAVGWGYCTVSFHTHAIHALHENDFIMAAKVDLLPREGALPES